MMTPDRVAPGTSVVTGAAGGIGAAIASALARAGAAVTLVDTDETVRDTAARIAGEGARALAVVADVADADAVHAAAEAAEQAHGPTGVLVNAAGVLRTGPLLELGNDDWATCLAVNATGVWNTGRVIGGRMYRHGGGSIVTVASNAAGTPRVGMAPYAASKAASVMITQCLGLELAPHVRCNIVCPGSTDTAMQRSLWPDPADDRYAASVVAGDLGAYRLGIPLGRIADPADIAEAVVFLADSRSRHITMQSLTVDGGATLGA